MKNIIVLCLLSILLFGCSNEDQDEKGKFDIVGKVTGIQTDSHCILVEDKDGGKYVVTLPENDATSNYKTGDHVVIWTAAINTSSPAKAEALHIEKENVAE
ncbi:DUF3221 domain-containing protein [Rummeliibacillus pycnus]|uniref:DUF3221 domain-containing protein n=1 Tax=Rummeliibacillus pycnus TaxID=101070 RepID=UPI003D26B8E3